MKGYRIVSHFAFYTKEEIIEGLKTSKYRDRFEIRETNIPEDEKLVRPNDDFQNKLVKDGLKYFAYIKFFEDNGEIYGIVAGKTGSETVNPSGKADVLFSYNEKHGFARHFLKKKGLKWYKDEIIVVKPEIIDNDKENEKEALAIEEDLMVMFNLLGS